MPDDLYESDILVWSEKQAALLRRLARGEGLNEAVDWDHVIEEVGDVGLSELHACENLLVQALAHLLKLHAEPAGPAAHWTSETIAFLGRARRRFSPSMRQRIDLEDLYQSALQEARPLIRSGEIRLPESCPYALDELLDKAAAVENLVAKLG
jgi:hypothetical protein